MCVLSFAATAACAGEDCKYSADRSAALDVAGAERIEIIARAGTLNVRPGVATTVKARGKACTSSEEYLAMTQLHARREGAVARIFVQVPDEMQGMGVHYATLDLTVEVPAALPVEITDTSGDMNVENAQVVHITDSSGDIRVRGPTADLEINDSSGELRVEDAKGAVDLTDSSGSIYVAGAKDVNIRQDSSGDIHIERIAGSVRIDNDSSGDIEIAGVGRDVEVVADSSGTVNVNDVKGTVRVP